MILRQSEVVPVLICIAILIFIWINRERLKSVPEYKTLIAGFLVLFAVKIFGILEEFFLGDLLNLFQHLCSGGTVVFLVLWCWKVSRPGRID